MFIPGTNVDLAAGATVSDVDDISRLQKGRFIFP